MEKLINTNTFANGVQAEHGAKSILASAGNIRCPTILVIGIWATERGKKKKGLWNVAQGLGSYSNKLLECFL